MTSNTETTNVPALGEYLRVLRNGLKMSLREVEEATSRDVSNAYLSQLENGKINKPSPNILHSLAAVYGASYELLMQRAGYISPTTEKENLEKHGTAATFAIENLSVEEEAELLKYLAFYRDRKGS
ncbi:MAG: helix-turn-helix domain-containing protein [Gammaproteobacteria bacterium]|nr:helix-turn-helix domain-containing protein [Gammaproteobacteria bacterium]MBL4890308.1 helix-turn-helix domain-containing protein [Rhizobiaceae bacterium]